VRAMIVAAIATGEAKSVELVVRLAKETHGFAAHEIDRIHQGFQTKVAATKAQEEQARVQRLEQASLLDSWKGQVEFGASRSTGNTSALGVFGALGFEREGLRWRHKLTARADLQETNGVTSSERLLASWQPRLRFDERFYTYGIAEYEYDRFQGYDNRYTLGGGGGYAAIATPTTKLDLEGGPAFRHTDYMDKPAATNVAARASLNFAWAITPTLEFKQNSSLYFEPGDSSANALSVIDAKLLGPIKARLSYDVRYESDVPAGVDEVNTQSRATLVYAF
jgi:putative salt-induced outer membrane protein